MTERIQRAATRIIPSLADVMYSERLKKMGLLSWEDKRERVNMIAVFRVMMGEDKTDEGDLFVWGRVVTRGHCKTLKCSVYLKIIKKYYATHKSVCGVDCMKNNTV